MASESEQVTVSTAGCCLAIITSQLLANQCDGCGLLFGTVSKEVIQVVNDRGSKNIVKTAIHIQAFSQLSVFMHDESVDQDCISRTSQKLNAVFVALVCARFTVAFYEISIGVQYCDGLTGDSSTSTIFE